VQMWAGRSGMSPVRWSAMSAVPKRRCGLRVEPCQARTHTALRCTHTALQRMLTARVVRMSRSGLAGVHTGTRTPSDQATTALGPISWRALRGNQGACGPRRHQAPPGRARAAVTGRPGTPAGLQVGGRARRLPGPTRRIHGGRPSGTPAPAANLPLARPQAAPKFRQAPPSQARSERSESSSESD
jgi:hypothetical protein